MTKRIPLSNGKFALVSDEDYERIGRYNWSYDPNGYACRMVQVARVDGKRTRRKVLMHRQILRAAKGVEVDHANHDGLDNRRENIRTVSHAQNRHNARPRKNGSSQYKGVSYHKRDGNWRASIAVNGIKRELGTFRSEHAAALAYNAAAYEAWGEFAYQNSVPSHLST